MITRLVIRPVFYPNMASNLRLQLLLTYSGTVSIICANPVCKSTKMSQLTQYVSFKKSVAVRCESCGQFICSMCKRPFEKPAGLSLHLRRAHSEIYHAAVPIVKKQPWSYETLSEVARLKREYGLWDRFDGK